MSNTEKVVTFGITFYVLSTRRKLGVSYFEDLIVNKRHASENKDYEYKIVGCGVEPKARNDGVRARGRFQRGIRPGCISRQADLSFVADDSIRNHN